MDHGGSGIDRGANHVDYYGGSKQTTGGHGSRSIVNHSGHRFARRYCVVLADVASNCIRTKAKTAGHPLSAY